MPIPRIVVVFIGCFLKAKNRAEGAEGIRGFEGMNSLAPG
jgi:hypothetical protein